MWLTGNLSKLQSVPANSPDSEYDHSTPPPTTSSRLLGNPVAHKPASNSLPPGLRWTPRELSDSGSEMYILSSRTNGKPKVWSACQWVISRCLRSAGETPARRNWTRTVGGASTSTLPSSRASACIRPGGEKALPVPRKSMRATSRDEGTMT